MFPEANSRVEFSCFRSEYEFQRMLTHFFRMTSKYKLTDKPQSNYAQVAKFYMLSLKEKKEILASIISFGRPN